MQEKSDRSRQWNIPLNANPDQHLFASVLFSDHEGGELDLGAPSPHSLVFSNNNSPFPLSKRNKPIFKAFSPKSPNRKLNSPFSPLFSSKRGSYFSEKRRQSPIRKPTLDKIPPPLFSDQNLDDNVSAPFSKLFCAESTANGSRDREDDDGFTFRMPSPLFGMDEMGDDWERGGLNRGEDRLKFAVSKLVKMRPLFDLVKRFYEVSCFESNFAATFISTAQDFELEILQALFVYLQISKKSEPVDFFIENLSGRLQQAPNRKKKKMKMIQLIFVQTFSFLKLKFGFEKARPNEKNKKDNTFFSHYFLDSSDPTKEDFNDVDYTKNINNGNIGYKFYKTVFESQKFSKDFFLYLDESFLNHYKEIRRRKLKVIFSRWEKHFLDFIDEKEAVKLILKEISSPRFKFVFHDNELRKYFQFFHQFPPK